MSRSLSGLFEVRWLRSAADRLGLGPNGPLVMVQVAAEFASPEPAEPGISEIVGEPTSDEIVGPTGFPITKQVDGLLGPGLPWWFIVMAVATPFTLLGRAVLSVRADLNRGWRDGPGRR